MVLVIVNEPPSNDEKFFKGKALTYYGRWTYKYEEAARRGAVGVLIIHRTDLASYGWDVVRNSQAVEKSYLQGDPTATLRAAAWIQHDVAQKLFTLAATATSTMRLTRRQRGAFHAVELPVSFVPILRAGSAATKARTSWRACRAQTAPTGRLYTAHYDHLGIDPNEGRQHLQRRSRQRHRVRHSA